jgi:hypothetical protein
MKKKIFWTLFLGILFLLPNLSSAGCTTIGSFTSFTLEGSRTVVLYGGSRPVASFDVQGCDIKPSSKIQLIKSYVCDGDEIMIDGLKCIIMEIKSFGP